MFTAFLMGPGLVGEGRQTADTHTYLYKTKALLEQPKEKLVTWGNFAPAALGFFVTLYISGEDGGFIQIYSLNI